MKEPKPCENEEPELKAAISDQVHELALISQMEHTPKTTVILELEPEVESEQVCEPVPLSIPVGLLVEYQGMERVPTHTPKAECAELYC